jgi:hypothetical protein
MSKEEYRQAPLPGFDTIDALKQYLISKDDQSRVNSYKLTPNNFLDAIENRIEFIEFRQTPGILGQIYINHNNTDALERPKVGLVMDPSSPHERQAETLAHEMTHVDRIVNTPRTNPMIDTYGSMSVGEFMAMFPDYFPAIAAKKNKEESLVSQAGKEFYDAHTSLARLALCLVWKRYETESQEE